MQTQQQAQKQNPTVNVQRLVWQLMQRTKQPLFGGTVGAIPTHLAGYIEIPDGNVVALVASRIAQSGIATGVPKTEHLDEAIANAAKEFVKATGKTDQLSAQEVDRFAVQYLVEAITVPGTAIVPFAEYLGYAAKVESALRALNAAEECSKPDAFAKMDANRAAKLAQNATKAWTDIGTLRLQCPMLAAVQTGIYAPAIYDAAAWALLAGLETQQRAAVASQIGMAITQFGNPFVSEQRVHQALAAIRGTTRHLSQGNRFGVQAATYVGAMEQQRATGGTVKPNGGTTVEISGIQTAFLGQQISGLNGTATAQIKATQDGLDFTVQVREGSPSPTRFPVQLPQQGAAHTSL